MKKVLIFPAGSEIGMEINNALKYSTHFEVFGLTSVSDHSEYVYKNFICGIPYYSEPNFIDKLNSIIAENQINYIYPAYDDVQLYMMQHSAEIDATIISADLFTTEICRSKSKTYDFFEGEDFVPHIYQSASQVIEYPVFVKPDIGQGSQGSLTVHNPIELQFALTENPERIICEYLPNEEYTVDCFTDFDGNLLCMKLRNRKRIRTGISVSSEILPMDSEVARIAECINGKLHFKGAWFFQLKKTQAGKFKLLEVAPRIAGTMGISRNSGVNYPLLTLFLFDGIDIKIITNDYTISVDRALISRYKTNIEYDCVYVDFDDTVCLNGKVNTFLIMFLYQVSNSGKSIFLLSRHKKDILESLKKLKINCDLFDQIIVITDERKKSSYIHNKRSIYIDDSFSERYDVSLACKIPVFDCSEIEALIDWRV